MAILTDWQIIEAVEQDNMIENFVDSQNNNGVISFGLSSFGYDMRIGPEFLIFDHANDGIEIDPKNIDVDIFTRCHSTNYVLIPPNAYALGYSVEKFNMSSDVMGFVLGKSTYARCGLIVNVTPLEPEWRGHVTIEISNSCSAPVRVYVNEGIAQVTFLTGELPDITYALYYH